MSLLDPTGPLRGLLVSLGVGAALFAAGYVYRWTGDEERYAARFKADQAVTHADYVARDKAANAAVIVTEAKLEKLNVVYAKALDRVEWLTATRVEYRNVCLPDDGVRLWNDANAGRHVDLQQADVDQAGAGNDHPSP